MSFSPAAKRLLDSLTLPIISAPMFLVSGPKLVAAASNAGIIGTFPALNARTEKDLDSWILQIKKDVGSKPYGINIIVHNSNKSIDSHIKAVVKHKVPIVITSLGAVPSLVQQIHSYGGIVFHDVTNARHAERAVNAGVDGLIAVCAGAGGHAGVISPFALIPQLRKKFPNTLIIGAGAVGTGHGVTSAIALGCDLVSIGTLFIPTVESNAQDEYKNMIASGAKESNSAPFVPIVYTDKISGIPANFMEESLNKAGIDINEVKSKTKDEFKTAHEFDEAKAWRDVWSAGHSIVNINKIDTVSNVVQKLKAEIMESKKHVSQALFPSSKI